MRAVGWDGGELRVREVPQREPGPGEILIEVTRAGVTLPVVRGGGPGAEPPGGDVAGTVLACGPEVTGWEPGRRIAGLAFRGAYAEHTIVSAGFAAPIPEGVSDDAAVAMVRGGQVALGVLQAAGVRTGDSVLVTAAAGGVGHLAVQLARVLGAGRVVAAIGPDGPAERVGALHGLGADEVCRYPDLDGVEPVSVVLDGAGGSVLPAALGALAPDGRLVTYNGVGGPVETTTLRMHAQSVIGFAMARLVARDPDRYLSNRRRLWDENLRGTLSPLVHGPFPLDHAARAHALIADRVNVGKVVLAP